MEAKTKNLALLGLNLVTSAVMGGSAVAATVDADLQANQVQTANAASLSTVETAWFAVPMLCKDRSFSSDPVTIKPKPPKPRVALIHQQLGERTA